MCIVFPILRSILLLSLMAWFVMADLFCSVTLTTYCPEQRHLVDSHSEEEGSGCNKQCK